MKIVKVTEKGAQVWYIRHWLRWYISYNDGTEWFKLKNVYSSKQDQ
jgi:hypothetical protein